MMLMLSLLLLWLTVGILACYSVWLYQQPIRSYQSQSQSYNPKVVVIIPVKGSTNLSVLWKALCEQIYTNWRLVFVVESVNDEAYKVLADLITKLSINRSVELIVAGHTVDTAQKLHNQLVALEKLRADDEVIVFADADIKPCTSWLSRTVNALADQKIWAVSGYRWLEPMDNSFATSFVCLANAAIATLPRLGLWNLAWGGTMALRRERLGELNMKQIWKDSFSDDLTLTKAIRKKGGSIYCPHALLILSPVSYSWREAIAFMRRQYILVRIYSPEHWLLSLFTTTFFFAGWIIAVYLAIMGSFIAIGAMLGMYLLDQYRVSLRKQVINKLWGNTEEYESMFSLIRWANPFCLALHAVIVWSTLVGKKINWAGRSYQLDKLKRIHIS